MIWQKLDSMLSISHMTISDLNCRWLYSQDVAKSDIPHTFALKLSSLKSMYYTSRAWNHQNYFHRIEFPHLEVSKEFSVPIFVVFLCLMMERFPWTKTKEVHEEVVFLSLCATCICCEVVSIEFVHLRNWIRPSIPTMFYSKIHRHVCASPNRWRMMIYNQMYRKCCRCSWLFAWKSNHAEISRISPLDLISYVVSQCSQCSYL